MLNNCYDFLMQNFGHVDIKGCIYIAELSTFRVEDSAFKYSDAYDIIASKYNTNRNAIERSVRYYITTIIGDSSLASICDTLDYRVPPDKTTLKITEFIMLLRKKLVGIE